LGFDSPQLHRRRKMKVYIVQGYSYEESYIMYLTINKEEALKTAKEFVKQKSSFKMGHMWFCVVEAELIKNMAGTTMRRRRYGTNTMVKGH
jgi:hypothetical protein